MTKVRIMLSVFVLFALLLTNCKKDELSELNEPGIDESHIEGHRSCGNHAHMEQLLTDPDYRRRHQRKLEMAEESSADDRSECNTPVVLPMAVHFQGITNPDAACLRALAQAQVDILNNDYQGTNSDITNWTNSASGSFPGLVNGTACIDFCLATQNHPTGYGLQNGNVAVTINQTNGDNVSAWSGYINIYVRPNLGYLGYSPLGGNGNGDGVVIDAAAFGAGAGCTGVVPNAPYNLGRTLTHELGHYLLLDHIWGGNGGCNDDDNVADTPVSTEPYYGCPNVGAATCSSTDLHMSYMDYTNDACMYMFSEGQTNRMENYVANNLTNVSGNAASVCGGTPPPPPNETCDAPTNPQISNISNTTATFTWNEVAEANDYEISVRPVGGNWTNYTATSNSLNVTDLSVCSDYQIRVRANCSVDLKSAFSQAIAFSTIGCSTGGNDCEAEAINPDTGAPLSDVDCIALVQENDPYCCNTFWDGICQDAYDECAGGGTPPPSNDCPAEPLNPWNGNSYSNADCVAYVQEVDPYCCETEWDNICHKQYKQCNNGSGSFATTQAKASANLHQFNDQTFVSYNIKEARAQVTMRLIDNNGQTIYRERLLSRNSIVELDKDKLAGFSNFSILLEYNGTSVKAKMDVATE